MRAVREFIPIISILQALLPSWFFGHIAAVVFAFIFGFHDHNCTFRSTPWISFTSSTHASGFDHTGLKRQIPKYFRTVAVANSSELLYCKLASISESLYRSGVRHWLFFRFPTLFAHFDQSMFLSIYQGVSLLISSISSSHNVYWPPCLP